MQFNPIHYFGSAPFSATIPPAESTAIQVTVDGAERGPCVASIDPPVESVAYSISAHVDSYGVVLVMIRNESGEALSLSGTVSAVCVEGMAQVVPHD